MSCFSSQLQCYNTKTCWLSPKDRNCRRWSLKVQCLTAGHVPRHPPGLENPPPRRPAVFIDTPAAFCETCISFPAFVFWLSCCDPASRQMFCSLLTLTELPKLRILDSHQAHYSIVECGVDGHRCSTPLCTGGEMKGFAHSWYQKMKTNCWRCFDTNLDSLKNNKGAIDYWVFRWR